MDFQAEILEPRLKKINETLNKKGTEYAHNNDRYYNFRVAAKILNINPEDALLGMLVKHLVSVLDLVDGNIERSPEMIDEKIGDTINYLILLEGLLKE